jgi:hypothetical protein
VTKVLFCPRRASWLELKGTKMSIASKRRDGLPEGERSLPRI